MNLAQISAAQALQNVTNLLDGGTLQFFSGTAGTIGPATPESATTGTLLATFTFANPAFGAASFSSPNEQLTANFVSSTVTPVASNTVGYARALINAPAWTASTAFSVGQLVTNSSKIFQCIAAGTSASSGGPTATTPAITDGTVTWKFIMATPATLAVADFTVNTSSADIIVGSTSLSTGVQVTITSFTLTIPAV